jgi:hypothetical protein
MTLQQLRTRLLRLSVAELHWMCKNCGVSFGAADKIRRGTTKKPRYDTVMMLARALERRKV